MALKKSEKIAVIEVAHLREQLGLKADLSSVNPTWKEQSYWGPQYVEALEAVNVDVDKLSYLEIQSKVANLRGSSEMA